MSPGWQFEMTLTAVAAGICGNGNHVIAIIAS
jgi:hypothetical protein